MLFEFWKKPDIFKLTEDMIHHWTTLLTSHVHFLLQDGKVRCPTRIINFQTTTETNERRRQHAWIFICLFGADPWKDLARVAARTGNDALSKRLYDIHMLWYLVGRVLMWPLLWGYNYFLLPDKIQNPLKVTPNCIGVQLFGLFSNFSWYNAVVLLKFLVVHAKIQSVQQKHCLTGKN
jgi:hypothetical protein